MRLLSSVIRQRIGADAINADAETTLVHIISDSLPADADLDDIDRAIVQARAGFSPLFNKPVTTPAPTVEPQRKVLYTVGGCYPTRKKPA